MDGRRYCSRGTSVRKKCLSAIRLFTGEFNMTRLLTSGVAVAALVSFGSIADAQQAQQPVQTMPNQGAGSGSDTGAGGAAGAGAQTQGGGAGAGAQTQMPENAQPGTAQQK